MKLYLLLISLALASAAIDYNSAITGTNCASQTPWQTVDIFNFQSPIGFMNTQCLPFGYFNLAMTAPGLLTFEPNAITGALSADYLGATLTSDQFKWTSQSILIRHRSEHTLYVGNQDDISDTAAFGDLEIQIYMTSTNAPAPAFVSFLVKSVSTTLVANAISGADKSTEAMTALANSKAADAVAILTGSTPALTTVTTTNDAITATLGLDEVATSIQGKIDAGLFLNMFTYNGTTTYPPCSDATWFVYGNFLYAPSTFVDGIVNNLNTAFTANTATNGIVTLTSTTNYNSRSPFGTAGSGSNGKYAARLCFSGYFDVYLNWNYGLWFGTVIIVFFFILTLMTGESPITDPDYKEEVKTIHPWISLWVVGNELFTRKLRASLILAIITIHCLMSSVFYRISNNPEQPANIIVYGAYSMVISQVFVFFYGIILRKYYIAKRQFHQTKEEKWNQEAQNRLFAYYSALFAIIALCWPFCVWNMNELNPHRSQKSSNYWVASLFVGCFLEWLVIDFIWVLLAKKSERMRNFLKYRGCFYDDLCHATYMDYIKMD